MLQHTHARVSKGNYEPPKRLKALSNAAKALAKAAKKRHPEGARTPGQLEPLNVRAKQSPTNQ